MDDTADGDTGPPPDSAGLSRLMTVLWIGVALGLLALIGSNTTGQLAAVGIGGLIFLSAFAAGCFFGFLFGLPRVSPGDNAPPRETIPAAPSGSAMANVASVVGDEAPRAPTARRRARLLQSNTNLERISDWLTTLLVGASLVQLHRINDWLVSFRDFLATTATVFTDASGQQSAGVLPAVGPIILIFGAVSGFLYMYLNTRLVLVLLFEAIERALSGDTKLPASQRRAVRAIAGRGDGASSFITERLTSTRGMTIDDALGLMFDLLYKDDPDRVIELGAHLASTAAQRPEYWFYLAAAFGQKLHGLDRRTDEWLSARDNALDCARRAVALSAAYRERLWSISDPKSSDNDLAPLREDPEFLRIVGRSGPANQ